MSYVYILESYDWSWSYIEGVFSSVETLEEYIQENDLRTPIRNRLKEDYGVRRYKVNDPEYSDDDWSFK